MSDDEWRLTEAEWDRIIEEADPALSDVLAWADALLDEHRHAIIMRHRSAVCPCGGSCGHSRN